MQSLLDETVLIVGLARNVEQTISKEIGRLGNIFGKVFREVRFFVVESDSSDRTPEILKGLADRNSHFAFVSLGNLESVIPNRIARLIKCRNSYVDWIRKTNLAAKVAVIDFDIRNTQLKSSQIYSAMRDLPDAAGIFTNQRGRYFDIYALRKEKWSESDCQSEYWRLRDVLGPEKAKEIAIWRKMKRIPRNASPIHVDSAFGGLGIYQIGVFQDSDYSPKDGQDVGASEHVYLHEKIRDSGGTLYIYPRLLNFSWNAHNLSSFKSFRYIDRISKGAWLKGVRRAIRNAIR